MMVSTGVVTMGILPPRATPGRRVHPVLQSSLGKPDSTITPGMQFAVSASMYCW